MPSKTADAAVPKALFSTSFLISEKEMGARLSPAPRMPSKTADAAVPKALFSTSFLISEKEMGARLAPAGRMGATGVAAAPRTSFSTSLSMSEKDMGARLVWLRTSPKIEDPAPERTPPPRPFKRVEPRDSAPFSAGPRAAVIRLRSISRLVRLRRSCVRSPPILDPSKPAAAPPRDFPIEPRFRLKGSGSRLVWLRTSPKIVDAAPETAPPPRPFKRVEPRDSAPSSATSSAPPRTEEMRLRSISRLV
ncbi:hypothetical protein BJV74DRAFT_812199, partial [Russula compacta]